RGAEDPAPAIPPVVINEILTHTDWPELDGIELFNPTPAEVNIGGWFLTDDPNAPRKYRIRDGTRIPASGFVMFAENQFNPTPGLGNIGTGFLPGETVTNQVVQIEGTDAGTAYAPWAAVVESDGNYHTNWYVFTDDLLNTTLELTATGTDSGLVAKAIFTDASGDVTVTPASGGGSISADTAQPSLVWPPLGTISIAEAGGNKSAIGAGTLVLKVPDGFEFNTSPSPPMTVSITSGSATVLSITANALTISVTSPSGSTVDTLSIS